MRSRRFRRSRRSHIYSALGFRYGYYDGYSGGYNSFSDGYTAD